ncbi:hypothetical protein [Roseovarius aquimarinus]|uniref:Lipoprotein n=1 Tax=Roseovarius aquimarinus TaxID=1229156 RepID=A0ABW7I5T9_9RHOB
MRSIVWISAATLLLAAGCEEMPNSGGAMNGKPGPAPEAVAAMAAKHQDLNAVTVDPSNGCYLYRYAGPVETTMLPLRTPDGRPICQRAATPAS